MLGFPVEFPLNSLKTGAPEKQGTPPFGCSLILRQTHVYIANGKLCICRCSPQKATILGCQEGDSNAVSRFGSLPFAIVIFVLVLSRE